jgi:hypothetical protein
MSASAHRAVQKKIQGNRGLMSLLMPSRPIVINPDLAYSIGLNEAIALQQVNYWLGDNLRAGA